MNQLVVLFKLPNSLVLPDSPTLAFLSPAEEARMSSSGLRRLYRGIEEVDGIREQAREFYVDLVSRVGATPCSGKTLRRRFAGETANAWWYHPFTWKDSEGDPTFDRILKIFAIVRVAQRENTTNILLYHSEREIAEVLASSFRVVRKGKVRQRKWFLPIAVLGRLRGLAVMLRDCIAIQKVVELPDIRPNVVFSGFWDWSVHFEEDKKLRDVYFKKLPTHLDSKGFETAWFVWFQPNRRFAAPRRSIGSILGATLDDSRIVVLQKFLSFSEIIAAFVDFRPFFRFFPFSRSAEFRVLFHERGIDYWPLVRRPFVAAFFGLGFPLHILGERAFRRAFARYRPRFAFTFQELFAWSRAFYQGGRSGHPQTVLCAVQHASYNREKTIGAIHPDRDYRGKPDGCFFPAPDLFFAMGEIGRSLFSSNGFPAENIVLSGSPRYDHIKVAKKKRRGKSRRPVNVLFAPSLNRIIEMDTIQATVAAVSRLEGIRLFLRSHPFARMEDWPDYAPYRKIIESTKGSLEEDLEMADLIVFSYSTIAEEAFLRGIPVCQWKTLRFNGSVFQEFPVIPAFDAVSELTSFFRSFLESPERFRPSSEDQERLLRLCFFKADGKSVSRIAHKLTELSASAG